MTTDFVELVSRMSAEQRAELDRALAVDVPFCPHTPTPMQRALLRLDQVPDVLFGGAVGGSKTFGLLMAALRYVDRPGYAALLLRETWTQLEAEPNGLMPILAQWLEGTPARWYPRSRTWKFPSGATVSFGYLQDPEDHRRYAGPSWHFIGIDQAEEIRAKHLLFMFSRLRKTKGLDIPIRYRLTANPGGRSHDYLTQRYRTVERDLDPTRCATCGVRVPAEPTDHPHMARAFLPSLLDDNPHLDVGAYDVVLAQLGETEHARLRWGDWGAVAPGTMFRVDQIAALNEAPPGLRLVRAWDLAATAESPGTDPDWTVGALLGRRGGTLQDPDALEVVLDVVRARLSPDGVDELMRHTAERDGRQVPIVVEQEGRSAGRREIAYIRRNLPGYTVVGVEPIGTKLERASPFARWVNTGRVAAVPGPWWGELAEELRRIAPGYRGHDDQMDALAIAHNYLDRHIVRPGVGGQLAVGRL